MNEQFDNSKNAEVQWGRLQTPLRFDRLPYPVAEAPAEMIDTSARIQGYEPEVINAIEYFLKPGDCAVDAGASIGFHTCLMSKLVGEDGLVFAFEPQEESFQYLVHHVHVANKLNNVACLQTALWKEDCPAIELWSVDEIGYSSFHRYMDASKSEMVEARALDTFLSSKDHPRLIKIDCEGTEAEVLSGAYETLIRGVDCVILELNFHLIEQTGRSDRVIRKYMADLGYDMFLINLGDNSGGFLPPLKVDTERQIKLQGGHHINVMFSTEEKVKDQWKV